MSVSHATEFDIAVFSKNKLCTFYVVQCSTTGKYHVFVVVYPHEKRDDQKGYIMSSHDDEKTALKQRNKFSEMLKNANVYDVHCNATTWYRDINCNKI